MTDQSNAELIAEARGAIDRSFHNSCQGRHADLLHRLAAALEAAEQRAEEAERELQVAEDQANNLAGDLAQAERERDRLDEAFDRDLPWRYDEVEAQRNQLAAVVEKVRQAASSHWEYQTRREAKFGREGSSCVCSVCDIMRALATAPDDALREVKAAAWAEGHDAGWEDRHQDALAGWMPSDPYESEAVNPYRKEQP